jgi:hypothetical protein
MIYLKSYNEALGISESIQKQSLQIYEYINKYNEVNNFNFIFHEETKNIKVPFELNIDKDFDVYGQLRFTEYGNGEIVYVITIQSRKYFSTIYHELKHLKSSILTNNKIFSNLDRKIGPLEKIPNLSKIDLFYDLVYYGDPEEAAAKYSNFYHDFQFFILNSMKKDNFKMTKDNIDTIYNDFIESQKSYYQYDYYLNDFSFDFYFSNKEIDDIIYLYIKYLNPKKKKNNKWYGIIIDKIRQFYCLPSKDEKILIKKEKIKIEKRLFKVFSKYQKKIKSLKYFFYKKYLNT